MKQKLYIAGLVNLFVILAGAAFKICHFPGAGILLTVGIVFLVLVILPLSLGNCYRNSVNGNPFLYILTGLTCLVVFTAMLFKIMHWPFASITLIVAVIFLNIVFLPVFVIASGRDGKFSIYNTVFILLLLVVNSLFSALLSLNVSKSVIDDSYNVPGSINILKSSLLSFPSEDQHSALARSIDDVLVIIEEYQETILAGEGLTEEEWNRDPYTLFRPDARDAVQKALSGKNYLHEGLKLRNGLNRIIETAQSDSDHNDLAKALPYFAGLIDPGTGKDIGAIYFTEDFLAWALVYLDSLETNLRILKANMI